MVEKKKLKKKKSIPLGEISAEGESKEKAVRSRGESS